MKCVPGILSQGIRATVIGHAQRLGRLVYTGFPCTGKSKLIFFSNIAMKNSNSFCAYICEKYSALSIYRGHSSLYNSLKTPHISPVRCRLWLQIWPKLYHCNCRAVFTIRHRTAIYRESIVFKSVAITSTIADWLTRNEFPWQFNLHTKFSIQWNTFKNIVFELWANFYKLQSVILIPFFNFSRDIKIYFTHTWSLSHVHYVPECKYEMHIFEKI